MLKLDREKWEGFSKCARCRRDFVRHFFMGADLYLHCGEVTLHFPAEYCTRIIHSFGQLKEYDGPVYRSSP